MEQENKPEFWAVVEVMGHNVFAGRVSAAAIGGASFVRVDVPEIAPRIENSKRGIWNHGTCKTDYYECKCEVSGAPAYTKMFGPGSIYCITPCSQEEATKVAWERRQDPAIIVDLPETMVPVSTSGDEIDLPF